VICLGAGLLASSLARNRNWAFALAFVLAPIFLLLFTQIYVISLVLFSVGLPSGGFEDWLQEDLEVTFTILAGQLPYNSGGSWSQLTRMAPGVWRVWLHLCWIGPLAAIAFFYVIKRFAAFRLARSWKDRVTTVRQEKIRRRFLTPIFRRRFKRASQRALDRNPIAWLQQYSWKSRITKWLLFGSFMLIAQGAQFVSNELLGQVLGLLLVILAIFYLFTGVSGFLEEKRSGALEMLLITPISANKLIFGRTWGLWKQFLPPLLILAGYYWVWSWFDQFLTIYSYRHNDSAESALLWTLFICLFLTLPVFATYFALRMKGLLRAAALTVIVEFVGYIMAMALLASFQPEGPTSVGVIIATISFTYASFALVACFLLRHSLSRRIYAF